MDAAIEESNVLRDEHFDLLAPPLDDPGIGKQRHLGPKRLAVDAAE
jgi:hypothetical protein